MSNVSIELKEIYRNNFETTTTTTTNDFEASDAKKNITKSIRTINIKINIFVQLMQQNLLEKKLIV